MRWPVVVAVVGLTFAMVAVTGVVAAGSATTGSAGTALPVSESVGSASEGVRSVSEGVRSVSEGVRSVSEGVGSASEGVRSVSEGVGLEAGGVWPGSPAVWDPPAPADGSTPGKEPEAADGNSTAANTNGPVKPTLSDAEPSGTQDADEQATGPGESVSIDANATYDADENVTFTLTGTQSRIYALYVYDTDGNAVVRYRTQLSARSDRLSFGSLDPGSYRVVVVEAYTGDKDEAVFGVDGPHEDGVVPEVVVDEPADLVQIPISLPNGTSEATVRLRNEDGEYDVRATIVDENGDGRVLLEWNTFYAGRDKVALRAAGPDAVENTSRARNLTGYLEEDEYHVTVRENGTRLDRGAIVVELEALHTTQIGVFEAPEKGSPEASFAARTESSSVEKDEWAFVVVRSEGVFGPVNSTADLRSVGPDQVMLTIAPEDGPPINLQRADYVEFTTDRIVYGFAPGNEALTVDTRYEVLFQISSGHPYRGGEDRTGVTLHVVEAGSEPDHPQVSIASVEAPDAVDADAPANFTVTLVNQGDRGGTVPVTVSIGGNEETREVSVPGNGHVTTVITYDTSRVVPGNREYVVRANDSRVRGEIQIGDADAAGPTLVQGNRGSGSAIPGFTIAGSVLALLLGVGVARTRGGP